MFCKKCILGVLKQNEKVCPVCRTDIKDGDLITCSSGKEIPLSMSSAASADDDKEEELMDYRETTEGDSSSKFDAIMLEMSKIWKEIDVGEKEEKKNASSSSSQQPYKDHGKILLFSQFLGFLDLTANALTSRNIPWVRIDGSLSQAARVAAVSKFESCKNKIVFLISMKAGGVGLNLCGASSCFIVDPWWNFGKLLK